MVEALGGLVSEPMHASPRRAVQPTWKTVAAVAAGMLRSPPHRAADTDTEEADKPAAAVGVEHADPPTTHVPQPVNGNSEEEPCREPGSPTQTVEPAAVAVGVEVADPPTTNVLQLVNGNIEEEPCREPGSPPRTVEPASTAVEVEVADPPRVEAAEVVAEAAEVVAEAGAAARAAAAVAAAVAAETAAEVVPAKAVVVAHSAKARSVVATAAAKVDQPKTNSSRAIAVCCKRKEPEQVISFHRSSPLGRLLCVASSCPNNVLSCPRAHLRAVLAFGHKAHHDLLTAFAVFNPHATTDDVWGVWRQPC